MQKRSQIMVLHEWFRLLKPGAKALRLDRHCKLRARQRIRLEVEGLEQRTLLSFAPPVVYSAADPGSPNVPTPGAIAIAKGGFDPDGILDLAVANRSINKITELTGN